MKPPFISLLHATFRSGSAAVALRQEWLDAAARPDSVEHIFALDADDDISVTNTNGLLRVVSPDGASQVTAVRNWNAAAHASTGRLMFVIADDLHPPTAWDHTIQDLLHDIDPLSVPFTMKIDDSGLPADVLLRHPIVSRAFYTRHSLFNPSFRGVFADNDFTLRAFWQSFIIDARNMKFEHRHPSLKARDDASESQRLMNEQAEYTYGREIYFREWHLLKRSAAVTPLKNPPSAKLVRTAAVWNTRILGLARGASQKSVARLRDAQREH